MINLLLIDNYDSFTYNLEHLFGALEDVSLKVVRNDDDFIVDLEKGGFDAVIISPGPGSPLDEEYFGKNMEVIRRFGTQGLPILGICLGFQGIAAAFGAQLKEAHVPQHGKTSKLKIIKPSRLLTKVADDIDVMRYHSLMLDMDKPFPKDLEIFAETAPDSLTVKQNGREIMGLNHAIYPIYGLQFHPESYATELGKTMAGNFIDIIKEQQ